MTKRILSQKTLKELIHYDSESGVFTWLVRRERYFRIKAHCTAWNNRNAGKKAGHASSHGYLLIPLLGKKYLGHRLAYLYVYGRLPHPMIDHINGSPIDNRLSNLREVDHSGNGKNRTLDKSSKTGISGVCWRDDHGRWTALIGHRKRRIYLGSFSAFLDAAAARKSAELKYQYHPNHGRAAI